MRIVSKVLISICIIVSLIGFILSLFDQSFIKITDTNMFVGSLAVLAAALSTWAAINLIDREENNRKPNIILDFDFSRYGLIQLVLRNIGTNPAFNISFNWESEPKDEGKESVFPDNETIKTICYGEKVYRNLGRGFELYRVKHLSFKGTISYFDSRGKKYISDVELDLEKYMKSMDFVEENPKAFYELQKVPKSLESIVEELKIIAREIKNNREEI